MLKHQGEWLYKNADSYDRGNGYHLDELLEDFEKAMGKTQL